MSRADVEPVRRAYDAYAREEFAEAGSAYSETVVYADTADAFAAAGVSG